jgi:4-amino-4-deoxy-L-arabinose transferase-like glycosyltransferase
MSQKKAGCALLCAIVALFCVRNLPWHLDNFDQAKQAYVSFEMVALGHWWYQHTPTQNIATKPPLAGWISAGLYLLAQWWDGAWRLPSLASALAILFVLSRRATAKSRSEKSETDPKDPAVPVAPIAAAAFGLNAFAPRLATLVRTDMLLTLFIFLIGWMIFEKLRTGAAWSVRDQWLVFFVVLGSMMTKGPIIYAFLLPGLAAFAFLCRRKRLPCNAWCGWWSWFAPLAVFLVWAGIGAWHSREFYEQVVLKEFLGRFTAGEHAVHKTQPLYFYVTHLLLKFAPWSVLLVALMFVKRALSAIASKPHLLWLACWAAGGLIFMSLVPSKRPDRIFPVILPLSLLIAGVLGELRGERLFGLRVKRVAWISIAVALAATGGYTAFDMTKNFRTHQGALAEFGAQVRTTAAAHGWRFASLGAKDEGMLLYLRQPKFLKPPEAEAAWKSNALQGLVVNEQDLKNRVDAFQPCEVALSTPNVPEKNGRYFFVVRSELAERH